MKRIPGNISSDELHNELANIRSGDVLEFSWGEHRLKNRVVIKGIQNVTFRCNGSQFSGKPIQFQKCRNITMSQTRIVGPEGPHSAYSGRGDALGFYKCHGFSLRNCTITHGTDETLDLYDCTGRIVVEDCIIGDNTTMGGTKSHKFAMLIGGADSVCEVILRRNLIGLATWRLPKVVCKDVRIDIINNLICGKLGVGVDLHPQEYTERLEANIVGNHFHDYTSESVKPGIAYRKGLKQHSVYRSDNQNEGKLHERHVDADRDTPHAWLEGAPQWNAAQTLRHVTSTAGAWHQQDGKMQRSLLETDFIARAMA